VVTKNQSKIAKTIDPVKDFKAVSSHFFTHFDTAKLTALIGRNNGAINMAHITTATEFWSNHRVAITLDKNISIQYNLSSLTCSFIWVATVSLSSFSSSKKSILSKKLLTLSSRESFCLS
jgi:hypothetical protein